MTPRDRYTYSACEWVECSHHCRVFTPRLGACGGGFHPCDQPRRAKRVGSHTHGSQNAVRAGQDLEQSRLAAKSVRYWGYKLPRPSRSRYLSPQTLTPESSRIAPRNGSRWRARVPLVLDARRSPRCRAKFACARMVHAVSGKLCAASRRAPCVEYERNTSTPSPAISRRDSEVRVGTERYAHGR